MPTNDDLSKELLGQNGIKSDGMSEQDREKIYQLLGKDKVRLKRIRWAFGITAGLVLISFIMVIVSQVLRSRGVDVHRTFGTDFVDIGNILFLLFLSCAVALSVMRRRGREHRNQLMEARLASIEEQLKRLAEKH
jgi:H+/gluconate symporter-like permease